MSYHVPDRYRIRKGAFASDERDGNNGAFFVPNRAAPSRGLSTRDAAAVPLKVIASDGAGWEHVSVSLPNRCPTWPEMAYIKALFWDATDCVVQYHPPESEYVNNHPFCLHLWRSTQHAFPLPDSLLVGFAGMSPEQAALMTNAQRLQSIDLANQIVEAGAPA